MIIARNIKDLVGKTPLIKINNLTNKEYANIYAKLEWYNIGGSVKSRTALYLIEAAKARGYLDKNKTIIEATSGNTGIALAMFAAIKGYKVAIVMPESASIERRKIIKAYGAELILSPGEKGTAGAIELKKKIIENNPEEYVDIDQFSDYANILAHYQTTGKEIIEQTNGNIDVLVVAIGTAGTAVGCSIALKEYNKNIKVIGVTPKIGVKIEGIRNPNEKNSTKLFRKDYFDEIYEIDEKEKKDIFKIGKELARKEGLLVGVSSSAAMYVALKKAKEIGKNKNIVVIFPDSGEKYLSTEFFE